MNIYIYIYAYIHRHVCYFIFEALLLVSKGAGGSWVRPGLPKQRSLSGDLSPAHSRCTSTVPDVLVRSSSDGNIPDPRDLIDKLRGIVVAFVSRKMFMFSVYLLVPELHVAVNLLVTSDVCDAVVLVYRWTMA